MRGVTKPQALALLAPGFGGSPKQTILLAVKEALAKRRIESTALSFPSGGLSEGFAREIAQLRRAREKLRRRRRVPIALIGRSFGGRICAFLSRQEPPDALVVLGWPIRPKGKRREMDEEALLALTCPTLIVQGERDELGPLCVLEPLVKRNRNVELHLLPGAGHAFGRHGEREAAEQVARWLAARLG